MTALPELDPTRLRAPGGVRYLRRWAAVVGLVVYARGAPWHNRGPGGSWRRLYVFTGGGHHVFHLSRLGGFYVEDDFVDDFVARCRRYIQEDCPMWAQAVADDASASYGPEARAEIDALTHHVYREAGGAESVNSVLDPYRRRRGESAPGPASP
jgi:hypothetical protein